MGAATSLASLRDIQAAARMVAQQVASAPLPFRYQAINLHINRAHECPISAIDLGAPITCALDQILAVTRLIIVDGYDVTAMA